MKLAARYLPVEQVAVAVVCAYLHQALGDPSGFRELLARLGSHLCLGADHALRPLACAVLAWPEGLFFEPGEGTDAGEAAPEDDGGDETLVRALRAVLVDRAMSTFAQQPSHPAFTQGTGKYLRGHPVTLADDGLRAGAGALLQLLYFVFTGRMQPLKLPFKVSPCDLVLGIGIPLPVVGIRD